MLCNDVRRMAYFFLDGSLGEGKRLEFGGHLELCDACEARIMIHRRMRTLVKERLMTMTAPARFRVRLSRSIRAVASG